MKVLRKILLSTLLVLTAGSAFAVRTVVFMYKQTVTGQDIFIKGGHDAGLVPSVYPSMSESITYNNTLNATTASIKANDASLDWGTESALDWTTSAWPAEWGTKRTYAVDGYGEDPENNMGHHWWKFDVNMQGSAGDYFEFKAFMRENGQESWENNISQSGTPYSTINHWGKMGYITKVRFGEGWVEYILIDNGDNTAPVASVNASPTSGTVATTFTFNAGGSTDADGDALQYRFDFDNDGTYDTSWSTSATATHSYTSKGTKTCKVEVTDGSANDTATVSVTVNNSAPSAALTASPSSVSLNATVTADASASFDADGDSLQYRFDWNNDGTYDTSYSSSPTADTSYSSTGTKTIKVQVSDGTATGTATFSVSVTDGGLNPHPGYFSGDLGAKLYSNGVQFAIWQRLAGTLKVRVTTDGVTTDHSLSKINGGDNDQVWWGFVPGAKAHSEYKFVIDEVTVTADPYSQYNRWSGGNSVVVDHSSFNWTDGSWQRPGWAYYAVYELHIKDLTSQDSTVSAGNRGKYAGVIEKLPYLQSLGITAIELMPISEFPDAGYGWGYNTSLYFAPESGYANDPLVGQNGVDQLKELVNAAHNHGIAVIIDMVFNHTANNDNWLWVIDNVAYFDGSTPWGNRLNTAHPIVQRLGRDNLEMWMEEYHIDGFRFDATGNGWIDYGFLYNVKSHCAGIDPNVYFVYENLPNNADLRTWGGQWSDGYHDVGTELLCGWNGHTFNDMAKYIYYSKDEYWPASPVEALNYVESHDEDTLGRLLGIAGFNDEGKRWRSRVTAVMLATSLGVPMIWMGQEFIRPREGQDISEIPLDWGYLNTFGDVKDYYAGVFNLRKNNPALRPENESGFAWQYTPWTGDANVIGYSMTAGPSDKKFVILLNMNSSPRTVWLGFPENGTWTKVIGETYVNGTSTINVNGYGASVTIEGSSGIIFQQ